MRDNSTLAALILPFALTAAICPPALAQSEPPAKSAAKPAPAPLPPPAPSEWRKVDGSFGRIDTLAGIEQLAKDIPYSSNVRLALLNAYLEANRYDEALAEAMELAGRGYEFSDAGRAELLGRLGEDGRDELAEVLAAMPGPIEDSRSFAAVPAEAKLVESLAYDAASGRLFASTIVSRELWVRDRAGKWTTLARPDFGSLGGLALDAERRTLWISSSAIGETPDPETAAKGLFALNLDTGEVIRLDAPEGASPGDIAVGVDGTVYASDPVSGAVYRAAPGASALTVLVPPGTFRSPQGLVAWPDGGLLVSDYGYGLALVDAAGKAWRVDSEEPALLNGIDGMWRHDGKVIAVQNGARPKRIVELTLSADGKRVLALNMLEREHQAWTEPLGGTLVGDRFVYVANGQWERFAKGGALREGAAPEPTSLRSIRVN